LVVARKSVGPSPSAQDDENEETPRLSVRRSEALTCGRIKVFLLLFLQKKKALESLRFLMTGPTAEGKRWIASLRSQ
jgi:hypothetical protein